MNTMKHDLLLCSLATLLLASSAGIVGNAFAQNQRIHHQITHARHDAPTLGRDCWFTLLDVGQGQGGNGSYYALYITSPNVTTAYVQLTGGATAKVSLKPYQSSVFNIPLAWGMTSSGTIEKKGIHVWSNDADLSCYVMDHSPYSSDGMYALPAIGWGKEYVVAGYAALFEGFGGGAGDYPSEFAIVANQNGTHVSVAPSADLRVEATAGGCCSCLAGSKGTTFQITLDAGQSVQYKTTCTQDCDNFDVTGTVITSDKIIGVVAGSMCSNIPCDFPYCDHVCEMMPPVRSWGENYYSLPFYQPPGMSPAHTASTFLVIATKPGQVIFRYDNDRQQNQVYFTASKKYDTYWRNDIDQGSHWFSDAPFLLVQYINSASYPDNVNGQGDPAEVILQPVEGYVKNTIYQAPMGIGNQVAYTNYTNIIAKSDDKYVRFDGASVLSLHTVYIDGIYTGYRLAHDSPGGHIVTSDSGVSVYNYGYGFDESYAWPGQLGTATIYSKDTTPPEADTSGACYTAHVALTDTDGDSTSLGFDYIRVDSIYNMSYTRDNNWTEGVCMTKSYYDMTVVDITQPAILIVSTFDQGGNRTTVTSSYVPESAHIGPPEQNFGTGNQTNCTYMYDSLINTGKVPFKFTYLHLVLGNQGFTIDSVVISPLAVGETRFVKLCFIALKGTTAYDTLRFSDGCMTQDVVLIGSGGAPDLHLTNHDFGNVLLGSPLTPGIAKIINLSSTQPITIDSMWVDDPLHFQPVIPQTNWAPPPFQVAPSATLPVQFNFVSKVSDTTGSYRTLWHALSKQLVNLPGEDGIRSSILTASVSSSSQTFGDDTLVTLGCPRPNNDSTGFQFVIQASGSAPSTITKIAHYSSYFKNFTVMRDNGVFVTDPSYMQEQLNPGQSIIITESFIAVQSSGGVYQDSIYAYSLNPVDGTQQLIGGRGLSATMVVTKCSDAVQPSRGPSFQPATLVQAGAGLLRVVMPADWLGTAHLELDNVLGVRVLDAAVDRGPVDVSSFPTGVYFYRLSSGQQVANGKIAIER